MEVTAAGVAGAASFSASGTSTGAAKIVIDSGNNQLGLIGATLPLPFVTVVTDAGNNRIANVPVTFTIKSGGGNFAGGNQLVTSTDSDGRALGILTTGTDPGNDNNTVEANFSGNPGLPASFKASTRAPGAAAEHRLPVSCWTTATIRCRT